MMDSILNALRSPGAMMVALVLALLAQGEHTAQVFAYFSHSNGNGNGTQLLAYAFAAAVEVAVLLFVLRGHKLISYVFAVATFATNMVYYTIGGIDLQSVALVPVVLLSALLPGVIIGYSHTIAETSDSNATLDTTPTATPVTAVRQWWQFWHKPQNVAARSSSAVSAEQTIVGVPVGTLVAQNAVDIASQPAPESPEQPQPATPKPAPVLRKVGKPGKTNEFGMTDTALAELLGVARQRIEPMRKSGTLMARVARDLPQLAAPHTNGFNHGAQ